MAMIGEALNIFAFYLFAAVRGPSARNFCLRAGSFSTSNACAIGRLLKDLIVLNEIVFVIQIGNRILQDFLPAYLQT